MTIVVLPKIEQENPFGELAQVISEQALPYLVKLYANKDKIVRLSDTELTDFVEVLQRHAPELVSNGKINWEKVNEWVQSNDPMKLKVATMLFDTKKLREEFANAPLIAKLKTIDMLGSVNPQELNKIFVANKLQQRLAEVINKSNLPDVYKLLLLSNIEKFVEKPELIPLLDKILKETETTTLTTSTQQPTEQVGGWKLSLEGSKPFGIRLEEPKLIPPQVSPPQINRTKTQKPIVGQNGRVRQISASAPPSTTPIQTNNIQSNILPPANETKQFDNTTSNQRRISNLEQLGWMAVKGLELVNSFLLGALLYALTRNPRVATKSPTLLRNAEKVATEGAKKGFEKVYKVSSETAKKLIDKIKGARKEVPAEEFQKFSAQIKGKPATDKTKQPAEDVMKKLDEVLKRNEEKINQVIKQEIERLKEMEKQLSRTSIGLTPSQISYLKNVEKSADDLMQIIKKYEELYGKGQNKVIENTKKSVFDLKELIERLKTKINIMRVEKELEKELTKNATTLNNLLNPPRPIVRSVDEMKKAERKAKEKLIEYMKTPEAQRKNFSHFGQPRYLGKIEEVKIMKPANQLQPQNLKLQPQKEVSKKSSTKKKKSSAKKKKSDK